MAEKNNSIIKFLKDWMLVISMITGASLYLIYHITPALHPAGPVLLSTVKIVQPTLLFIMLFLSFCKIEPMDMKPRKWMIWLLLIQGGLFAGLSLLIIWACGSNGATAEFILKWRPAFEAALLCLICPTATACAVVTGKLGGDMAGVVTYTVLINLMVAILIPLIIPFLYPDAGLSFGAAFGRILAKIFPLLILPAICAWAIKLVLPRLHDKLVSIAHWSFYIWAVGLCLAILMSTRGIVISHSSIAVILGIAAGSLLACIFQFWTGRQIGKHYGSTISAGQALGQKNTVFAIWVGYTFMNPVVSVAGGFYSIWHNLYNSWQLYQKQKN